MSRRQKPRAKRHPAPIYTWVHELTASPTEPTPEPQRRYQLERMHQGMYALLKLPNPTPNDWGAVSDAVNFLETLVELGHVEDASGLLQDAITALAQAGERHRTGQPLRLSGAGIDAVRAVLEDYEHALNHLPHRVMVRTVRLTEKRIYALQQTGRAPKGVKVVMV